MVDEEQVRSLDVGPLANARKQLQTPDTLGRTMLDTVLRECASRGQNELAARVTVGEPSDGHLPVCFFVGEPYEICISIPVA